MADLKDKDIDELTSGLTSLVGELSNRACKAERLLYEMKFLAEEDVFIGGNKSFSKYLLKKLEAMQSND